MEKRNYNYKNILFSSLILFSNIFSGIFSFPFYNLQSEQLFNGNYIFVHQYGIDIVNNPRTKIIRSEITFAEEEQITKEKMQNVIIKMFEDGYLICLINGKIYIFDDTGHILYKSENIITTGKTVNYYSLNIKDKNN